MENIGTKTLSSQTIVRCGACLGTLILEWYCLNCGDSLCNECQNVHQTTTQFKNHVVFKRTYEVIRTWGPAKIAEICRAHPTQMLSTYCSKCDIPCCDLCKLAHADRHQCNEFPSLVETYLSAEERLNKYTKYLEKNVKPSLDVMRENTATNLEHNNDEIDRVKLQINTFRLRLKQTVDVSCDLLLQELDHLNDEFKNIESKINSAIERIDELIQEVQSKISVGKLDLIKYAPPDPVSLIPDSTLPMNKVPIFIQNNDLIESIKGDVGKIVLRNVDKSKAFDKSKISVRRVISFPCNFLDSSIEYAGNRSAWIVDSSVEKMFLYENSGKLVRSMNVDVDINDMAVASSGDLVVTCGDMKVRHLTVRGWSTTLINTAPYEPDGICLTDKEEIVVCMRGQDNGKHIAVFSDDGQDRLHEISGRDSQSRRTVTDPYHVVQNSQDLCVVNKGRNVVCFDQIYDVKWMYNGKEAKIGALFSPRCICVDKHHNLLVSDNNNHCVHYINREGGLIQLIMTQEQTRLLDPLGICVDDETGQVWLGNYSGDVVIAEYLK